MRFSTVSTFGALFLLLRSAVSSSDPCPSPCSCRHKEHLYVVDCSGEDLVSVPDLLPLRGVAKPKELNFYNNEIKQILNSDFPTGITVEILTLSKNSGVQISDDAFGNLVYTLKTLELEGVDMAFNKPFTMLHNLRALKSLSVGFNNKISYTPGAVEHVKVAFFQGQVTKSLTSLKMQDCRMRTMSSTTLDSLTNLEELDLSNNWFTSIPDVIKHLLNLKKLTLSRIKVSPLMDFQFSTLVNLEHFNMESSPIRTIQPKAFAGLRSLKHLQMNRCSLDQIPSVAMKDLAKLEYLDLAENSFKLAPADSFSGSYCVQDLRVSAKGLRFDENAFVGQRKCVEELHIRGMDLEKVPRAALVQLEKLRNLNLEHNSIAVLPAGAFSGIKATTISVGNNPLHTIQPGAFSGLPPNLAIKLGQTKMTDIDFLLGYPEGAIESVEMYDTDLQCRCSMKSSLNATLNVEIFGTCSKGNARVALRSSTLEGILDQACEEERALNSGFRPGCVRGLVEIVPCLLILITARGPFHV